VSSTTIPSPSRDPLCLYVWRDHGDEGVQDGHRKGVDRFLAAFAVFLFGCGTMAVLLGLTRDLWVWETKVLAGVGWRVLTGDQNH
jgi:hypothetical protein